MAPVGFFLIGVFLFELLYGSGFLAMLSVWKQ